MIFRWYFSIPSMSIIKHSSTSIKNHPHSARFKYIRSTPAFRWSVPYTVNISLVFRPRACNSSFVHPMIPAPDPMIETALEVITDIFPPFSFDLNMVLSLRTYCPSPPHVLFHPHLRPLNIYDHPSSIHFIVFHLSIIIPSLPRTFRLFIVKTAHW